MPSFGGTRFRLRAHHEFVRRHESELVHYQAGPCPCALDRDANRARPSCNACGGQGYIYRQGARVWGILTDAHTQKDLRELGILAPGDVTYAPSPYDRRLYSDHDLFRSTWSDDTPFEGEAIVRGPAASPDALTYPPRRAILVAKREVDETITEYVEGTDFTLSHDGRSISWLAVPGVPAQGDQYVAKYVHDWEWIAFAAPTPRFERGSRLGPRFLLRRKHVVYQVQPAIF